MSGELNLAAAMLMGGDDYADAGPVNHPFTYMIWPIAPLVSAVAASLVWNDFAGSWDDTYWKPVMLTGYASLAFVPMWFIDEYYGWGALGDMIWQGLSLFMGWRAEQNVPQGTNL